MPDFACADANEARFQHAVQCAKPSLAMRREHLQDTNQDCVWFRFRLRLERYQGSANVSST